MRFTPGCKCCCGWKFITRGCNNFPLPGTLVEIRQSGVLIDSCTTASSGPVIAIRRGSGGTGYTNGSYTNGTFSGGGGTGGAFSYTVSGGVIQPTITVTSGGTGYTSAPTPVFNAGAGSGATATATLEASCRLTPPAGTYDVTLTPPSRYASQTASRSFSCSGSTDSVVTLTLLPDSSHVCIAVCDRPISKTLYTSDGLGTHTLTWNGSVWVGTATVSSGVKTVETTFFACDAGTVMTVTYTVDQSLKISVGWRLSCCYTRGVLGTVIKVDYVYSDDTNGGSAATQPIGATGSTTISSCSPVSATTNVATTGTVGVTDQYFCMTFGASDTFPGFDTPGGGGLMAVTE